MITFGEKSQAERKWVGDSYSLKPERRREEKAAVVEETKERGKWLLAAIKRESSYTIDKQRKGGHSA